MHADALTDHAVRGASVYTLADTASDAQTAALARRENSADRFGGRPIPHLAGGGPHPGQPGAPGDPRRLGAVARDVVGALGQDVPMLPNPARHAGFVVLKAADIPSVLVEMGFMSNRADEAALRRPAAPRAGRRGDAAGRRRLFRQPRRRPRADARRG